jgi:16S rRNA (uracil1498-N3)-methyltransferase
MTLIQGLSRHDRMDATIQKSIELGVNRIIPVLCQRSNAKLDASKRKKKLTHWKKIAISACEQSGRSIIPEICEIIAVSELCSNKDDCLQFDAERLLLDPESSTGLKSIDIKGNAVEILIGPEGGLSAEEISQLADTGFTSICFGPRILRTETAGPAVISALQTLWGDF